MLLQALLALLMEMVLVDGVVGLIGGGGALMAVVLGVDLVVGVLGVTWVVVVLVVVVVVRRVVHEGRLVTPRLLRLLPWWGDRGIAQLPLHSSAVGVDDLGLCGLEGSLDGAGRDRRSCGRRSADSGSRP